jgi:hypothetical protein
MSLKSNRAIEFSTLRARAPVRWAIWDRLMTALVTFKMSVAGCHNLESAPLCAVGAPHGVHRWVHSITQGPAFRLFEA